MHAEIVFSIGCYQLSGQIGRTIYFSAFRNMPLNQQVDSHLQIGRAATQKTQFRAEIQRTSP